MWLSLYTCTMFLKNFKHDICGIYLLLNKHLNEEHDNAVILSNDMKLCFKF